MLSPSARNVSIKNWTISRDNWLLKDSWTLITQVRFLICNTGRFCIVNYFCDVERLWNACFTVFSAVFLDTVSLKLPLTILQSSNSHLNATSFDPVWTHGQSSGHTAHHPPRVRFPTCKRQDCRDSRDSLGIVLSETVTMVSLSAPPRVPCSEQLVHSRTAGTIWKPRCPPVSPYPWHRPTFATGTDTTVACQKKHRHWLSSTFLPP